MLFVHDEPAAIWDKWLIVSDLHVSDSNWKVVASGLRDLLQRTDKRNLLVLGDVKDRVVGRELGVGKFIRDIGTEFDLHIVKGNHDGNIEQYSRYCTVYDPRGAVVDGLGCFHGHAWPYEEVLECSYIAVGHTHPRIKLSDNSYYESVWLISNLNIKNLSYRYPSLSDVGQKVVLFPSFNERGCSDESSGVVGAIFIKQSAKIYTLKGIRIR